MKLMTMTNFHLFKSSCTRATRHLADQSLTDQDRKMLLLEANTWELLQRVYECVIFSYGRLSGIHVDYPCPIDIEESLTEIVELPKKCSKEILIHQ
jgi:hypothetical protein